MLILSHTIQEAHMIISPIEFGICNKYKEINFSPKSENRIFGYEDRFNQNNFVIETEEGAVSC